jgi:hypothetical protein
MNRKINWEYKEEVKYIIRNNSTVFEELEVSIVDLMVANAAFITGDVYTLV